MDPVIDFYFEREELSVDENSEEPVLDTLYRVFLVLRRKDTLQDEDILTEMHLVLEEKV
jgi:hypothetical protein